jgi:hypothetical protein
VVAFLAMYALCAIKVTRDDVFEEAGSYRMPSPWSPGPPSGGNAGGHGGHGNGNGHTQPQPEQPPQPVGASGWSWSPSRPWQES